jgi:glutamine amidotransferase
LISIIDYGVGNIKAFVNIYKILEIDFSIAKSKADLESTKKIILPGVGSFDYAMRQLQNSGMKERLDELVLQQRVPVLGICVGMQMLAESSEEGVLSGLGWVEGTVKRFGHSLLNDRMPLPHMGWNTLNIKQNSPLLFDLEKEPSFYFLHSYYLECKNKIDVVATTSYGDEFSSVVTSGNIYGIQCHPEKSHHSGTKLLKNFGVL